MRLRLAPYRPLALSLIAASSVWFACATSDPIEEPGGGQPSVGGSAAGGASGGVAAGGAPPMGGGPLGGMPAGGMGPDPGCGDGMCGADETCQICPADCGDCPVTCNDGVCDATETCDNCFEDCGVCPCVADQSEPNNDAGMATNIGLGVQYCRSICAADEDWLAFSILNGFSVTLDFVHAKGDLDLEVYSAASGQLIGGSYGTSNGEAINASNLPAGVYRARIYGAGGEVNPDYCFVASSL